MLIFDKADINSIMKAIIPILYAGVMSSGIAYTFQIIGQKYAKPSVTAIVLSLESVFAALAGWILLGEHLSTRELTGCILVFTAVIIAQIPQFAHNALSFLSRSVFIVKKNLFFAYCSFFRYFTYLY